MDLTSHHPSDSIELPAILPPLNDAITEQEHDVILADNHKQVGLGSLPFQLGMVMEIS